jgi:hypothetical protein
MLAISLETGLRWNFILVAQGGAPGYGLHTVLR